MRSAKTKKAQAIVEKVDYALEGFLVANYRLPCPDVTGDGIADPNDGSDCTSYVGNLPYITLGLSSGKDPWNNPLRYSVYGASGATTPDLTNLFADASDFVTNTYGLSAASTESANGNDTIAGTADDGFISTKVYTTFTDINDMPESGSSVGVAYVIVSGGAKDLGGPVTDI
ncbi:MAG: type II secretion system protein GspG [Thermodesulfobacteriota bacterium]|nr:type II secretion system protein GspG [Thermodesulfobacteriota bacterium]